MRFCVRSNDKWIVSCVCSDSGFSAMVIILHFVARVREYYLQVINFRFVLNECRLLTRSNKYIG